MESKQQTLDRIAEDNRVLSEEAYAEAFRSIKTIAFVEEGVQPVWDWKFPSSMEDFVLLK